MKPERMRLYQIALLILLIVCFAQVLWWVLDQYRLSAQAVDRAREQEASIEQAAEVLLELGAGRERVLELFPGLAFDADGKFTDNGHGLVAQVRNERIHRLIRYCAEGSFFLIVLVIGMGILSETLKRHAELHRREHNFLAAVSHELKSPIASIRLSAETISLRDPPSEKRQALIGRMLDDLSRLEKMVLSLLDTTLLDDGYFNYRPETVRLAQVAELVANELREQASAQKVELVNKIPRALELRVDPIAIQTILHNLVDNAVKATAKASGGKVRLSARVEDGRVQIEVADNGIGIESGELKKIFRKFYRPGDEMRRESRGSGLGLYLVQRFAELGRGTVLASSDGPGKGAVFTVSLPAIQETQS